MKKIMLLAIGILLLTLLFGCAQQKAAEKLPAAEPKIEEKDITATEEDYLFTDDLDDGIKDLEELENSTT